MENVYQIHSPITEAEFIDFQQENKCLCGSGKKKENKIGLDP